MNKKILYIATLMLAMTSVAFAQSNDDVTAMRLSFDNVTVVPEGMSEASPEGTWDTLDGRLAIVVDLGGSIGKVAVAMENAGDDTAYGSLFNYSDANNPAESKLTDGWYIPSKDEMEALKERLTWTSSQRYKGHNLAGAIINFETGSSLFLPAAGYYNNSTINRGTTCAYWTSTAYSDTRTYKLEMNSSSKAVDNGGNTIGRSLRPFHALPKVTILTTPTEREHMLEVSSIENTNDGIRLSVNGQSVTYPSGMLKEITFFDGTPSVQLHANQDPDNAGNYYTTFYSGLEAYNIPDYVKAYTATMDEENDETVVRLTAIEGDVLPQGEAVLLHSTTTSNMQLTVSSENADRPEGNLFSGVDVCTEQDGSNYMLSYGQNKLGFYLMKSDMFLSPNKAFLPQSAAMANARAFRMVFADSEADGIEDVNVNKISNSAIYNLNGVRLDKLQKGINIVNGKKIIVR